MNEQRIRELCLQLRDARDEGRIEEIGNELRAAIHEHVESLRHEVTALPTLETFAHAA